MCEARGGLKKADAEMLSSFTFPVLRILLLVNEGKNNVLKGSLRLLLQLSGCLCAV